MYIRGKKKNNSFLSGDNILKMARTNVITESERIVSERNQWSRADF
jgi:hypothetical protein